ncbi:lipopolysaccharide assembly protein LapB [Ammoniphilus sp. CFH 90114]|uniref:tetratricopeptide repeat protein n=1 Tax=Ammoniphilus sp. CFH 90114 TaxID=2493665 RepID=UPI00100E8142|nr:tetratricopeptide repeat protein [Ammoniphilus sp. CFH 90114]RXT04033.1 tetratricopeptide repeat protein [Ammoniphilus sp. CFH 90114]
MPLKPKNVIPMTITADFYIERANKSLDRYNYAKALYYYKKAVEMEPHNALLFCNMAGVLGHLGKYQESNEVLQHVLQKMDENAVECHYYLACNYVYLDLLEKAEEHALIYLRKDPTGRYVQDAEELLEYLGEELEHPQPLPDEVDPSLQDEKTSLHEKARILMEEGSFQQAEKLLIKLTSEYPDFLAASNNLSLCYYYKGEFEKARDTIHLVLEQEPHNIHALCNLAILYYQQQEHESLGKLLSNLKKLIPLQYDQAYKLGITLGVMGEHQTAYQLFRKMAGYAGQLDFHLFHYCAVSAYNTGHLKEAEKYWKMVQLEDPGSPIAPYYLERLKKGEKLPKDIPYYYHLPTYAKKKKKTNTHVPEPSLQEEVENDPFIRSSFLWALRHGDRETKLQVLQAFEWLGDQEVIEALLEFVQQADQDEELKRIAQFVLKTLGYSSETKVPWKKTWHRVLESLRTELDEQQQHKAGELWSQYIHMAYPDIPVIRKPEAWAAALEWMVAGGSLEEVASYYEAAPKTVKKHIETMEKELSKGRNLST